MLSLSLPLLSSDSQSRVCCSFSLFILLGCKHESGSFSQINVQELVSFIQTLEDMMKFELLLLCALLGLCTIAYSVPTAVTLNTEDTTEPDQHEASSATESTVQATESVAHSDTPAEIPESTTGALSVETERPSANTQPPVEETDASSANTETPVQPTEEPVVLSEAPFVNTVETTMETVVTGTSSQVPKKEVEKETPETEVDPMTNIDGESEAEMDSGHTEAEREVEVEDSGVLGTGQVISIVIGALVAVVIIIAVIVVVVRRMGQYSP